MAAGFELFCDVANRTMIEKFRHVWEIDRAALLHGNDERVFWGFRKRRNQCRLDGALGEDVCHANEVVLLIFDLERAEEIISGIDGKFILEGTVFADAAEFANVFLIKSFQLMLFCLERIICAALMLDGEYLMTSIAQANSGEDAGTRDFWEVR